MAKAVDIILQENDFCGEKPTRSKGHFLLLEKLSKLAGTRILVVGDIGLDEYVSGDVKRISPEAPVPVLDVTAEDRRLGLSANVAQNLHSLGGQAVLVSVVGNDPIAGEILALLEQEGVDSSFVIKDATRPTTRKLRVLTGHHHIVRIDYEKRRFLSPEIEDMVLDKVKRNIESCQGVILQDYGKGMLSERLIQMVIKTAASAGKPVLIDPYRTTPLHFYRGADLIKPNFDEAVVLSGFSMDAISNPVDLVGSIGVRLRDQAAAKNIVITRGREGMSLFTGKGRQDIATAARQVFDVTGAGDTVVAAIALAWCSGLDLADACRIANYAAGIVVSKIGCVPCPLAELQQVLKSV